MKKPLSPLPWRTEDDRLFDVKEKPILYDYYAGSDAADVIGEVEDTRDAQYIVEACNNYPKAIELLKYFVNRVEEGSIRSNTTYAKYKDFLKSIEDESKRSS